MTIQRLRKKFFPILHPLGGRIGKIIPPEGEERALIREKGDEYVLSVSCSEKEFKYALRVHGYLNNYLSTLKYIETESGKVWESGTMAYRKPITSRWMHHVYWFPAGEDEYTFHVHHHKERNYLDLPDGPSEHTSDMRTSGDPDSHLSSALDAVGIDYEVVENEEY